MDVGGIGPRVAIGILSVGRPEEIVTAIQQENVVLLMKLPGIGKKTAQRIILDLKDKLVGFASIPGSLGGLSSVPAGKGSNGVSMNWLEAKEALLALGYSEMEAERAGVSIRERITPEMNVDAVIKLALKELYTNG
ncbi:MAG: hypothetical protein A2189_08825 [Paenibacillus sp. RIFOXYA1_FULL_44_5]|nr:MAG: hypothetical protein A2189_08825 [Paenibacillus sp. RIFOXYA1_FULL_44_5]